MGISLWIASLAALTRVAAEGTTSAEGVEVALGAAGTRTVFVGAGADIVCRRKGNLSNIFYAESFTALATGATGTSVGAAKAGVNSISF